MSSQMRALHILRASSQPGRLRCANIAHLDRTITTMRRLVPSVNSAPVPEKVNTVEELETLLTDTIHLFKKIIENPEIVVALRSRMTAKTNSASSAPPTDGSQQPAPPAQSEVDNLFTLFKLKRRSKKRLVTLRI